MEVVRTVIRSLVLSLVVAVAVMFVAMLFSHKSYGSGMTPEEQESMQSMTLAEAQAFMLEHQVIRQRGWGAFRNSFRHSLTSRSFLYFVICGFVNSLVVVGWNNRKRERASGGVPNKDLEHSPNIANAV